MADTSEETSGQTQPQFSIQKIYVKDLSFETPNSPSAFTQEWKPDVNVELDTKGQLVAEDVHEVVLGVTVTVKLGDNVAFLAEIHQAGIFAIKGFNDNEKAAMLGSYCPNLLFPFAREVVSDLVTKGGFPQLLLAPVNFDALYQQHLARIKEKNSGAESGHDEESESVH